MVVRKNILYILGILILIALAGIFFINGGNAGNNDVAPGSGEVQKVIIGIKNYNYYPNTIKVKVNQPVEISLDGSVTGCFRDFTIREFGVRKYLRTPQDKITFTPTKKGTFTFACSMGMGIGQLVVE